jgi:hypothetical protein
MRRRAFSKADLKALCSIVAVALLLSTVPFAGGVVVVSVPSQPQFTVNVCQPTQASNCVSDTALARPAVNLPQSVLFSSSSLTVQPTARTLELNVPPETPPPKRVV